MRWVFDTDMAAFAAQVLPWAELEPVLNNVLYTVVKSRSAGLTPVEDECVWARCLDGDELHAVAVRTAPHPLLVSPMSPAAAKALASDLPDVPAVTGVPDAVRGVLAATGREADLAMAMRIYQLDRVTPAAPVPGALRRATEADQDLAAAWVEAFARDGHTQVGVAADYAANAIAGGRYWLWDQGGQPVTMTCTSVPAAGIVRVGPVYTPAELRRRGYASACVAAVSQRALDDGARGCMLYTDLSNPTSNAIYQAVGYRPVAEAETWEFRAPRARQ